MTITASALDREALGAWYRRNRERSRAIFDLIAPDAYYDRPIALRHPVVFYDGHLPAFSFNTLVKKALGRRGIDQRLETLFARGIDPHEQAHRADADSAMAEPRRSPGVRGGSRPPGARCRHERRHRAAGAPAARPRRGGVRDSRARGDAPGNAALHVAPPSVRSQAAACRVHPARGRRRAGAAMDPSPRWRCDARRTTRLDSVRLGQRIRRPSAWTCRLSSSSGTTRRTRGSSNSSRPADIRIPSGGRRRTGSGACASRSSIRCSGIALTAGGTGEGCSSSSRCRPRGPCT